MSTNERRGTGVCSLCNGTGTTGSLTGPRKPSDTCYKCKGTGRCSICRGKGYVSGSKVFCVGCME